MKRFKISGCALPPVMFTKFSTSIRWDVLAFACLASASRFARLACTICTATTRIPRHSGTEHRTHGKCECQIVPGSKYCHWHKPTWNQLKSFTCVSQDWVACCNKIPCEVKKKETSIDSLGGFQLQTFKIILQSQLSLAVTSLTTCHLPPQLDRRGAFGHWPDSWDCSLLRACWEQPFFAEIGPATILVTKVGLVWWWGLWVKLLSYYYIIIYCPCWLREWNSHHPSIYINLPQLFTAVPILLRYPGMCWLKLAGGPGVRELPDVLLQVTVDPLLLLDPLLAVPWFRSWIYNDHYI